MILDDLYRLYELKRESGEVPPRGWSREKVSWEIAINGSGELQQIVPLAQDDDHEFVWMDVPLHETRTSGVKPYALCDKVDYFFGLPLAIDDPDKQEKARKKSQKNQQAAIELHRDIFESLNDPAIQATLAFLKSASAETVPLRLREPLEKGQLMVFRYLPDNTLVHERPDVKSCWDEYFEANEGLSSMQCSVTGRYAPAAQLFPQLKVPGAQPSGAALVSFNQEAFCSYGKSTADQAINASISADVANGVGRALDYLVTSRDHCVSLGDTQVLFWTDKEGDKELDELMLFLNPDWLNSSSGEDEAVLQEVQGRLMGIKGGRYTAGVDSRSRYYLLGVSPNKARLAIRFYETGTLGQLDANFSQYLRDIDLVDERNARASLRVRSLRAYIYQTAALGKAENVPSTIVASVLGAMMRGRPFPRTLYLQLLERTRIDKGYSGTGDKRYDALSLRVPMLKACLLREARQKGNVEFERSLTVALNEENTNTGYLLGRLFAVLEKCQRDALGRNINATIRDKYIGSASTTPARVFPRLMGMAQHHISKAEYGEYDDGLLQSVFRKLDDGAGFPATLSYSDQGQFFIGYYQQKAAFYAKAEDSKEME